MYPTAVLMCPCVDRLKTITGGRRFSKSGRRASMCCCSLAAIGRDGRRGGIGAAPRPKGLREDIVTREDSDEDVI
jgi:hypothetical protein